MKQELKKLLIKDLCSRLSYGLKVKKPDDGNSDYVSAIDVDAGTLTTVYNGYTDKIEKFIPYLRPMNQMTEEEKKEYGKVCELDTEILANHPMNGEPFPALYNSQDWLNKKMFAYRTLDGKDMFELGLALEAPEGMYN